jgi:hypothetical protein
MQTALWRLGGVRIEHRTDNLIAGHAVGRVFEAPRSRWLRYFFLTSCADS